jgi:hypothetical protein
MAVAQSYRGARLGTRASTRRPALDRAARSTGAPIAPVGSRARRRALRPWRCRMKLGRPARFKQEIAEGSEGRRQPLTSGGSPASQRDDDAAEQAGGGGHHRSSNAYPHCCPISRHRHRSIVCDRAARGGDPPDSIPSLAPSLSAQSASGSQFIRAHPHSPAFLIVLTAWVSGDIVLLTVVSGRPVGSRTTRT